MTTQDQPFVILAIPDINGTLRGKALRPKAFDAAVTHGARLTNLLLALDPTDQPITDYETIGIRSGAEDLIVLPELETLRPLSWAPGWKLCLGTPSLADGSPCVISSREVLNGALGRLRDVGYDVLGAVEYEVRIYDGDGRPTSSGISYSAPEITRMREFLTRICEAAESLGIDLEAAHTEAGPGLVELNVAAQFGLRAADDAALLKLAVKEVASSLGLRASFLAKPAEGQEGSSGHVHLSLWANDKNAFADGHGAQPFAGAIAGILEHLPAASLLLNPTINSYKRLIPGWFAPVNLSWGVENRSCALRAISGDGPEKRRIECRRPGADANPYLVLAALLAAAREGIEREAIPPEPRAGDISGHSDLPALPGSLESALNSFASDHVFRRALGEEFSAYYEVSRRWELRAWRQTVTAWEQQRYEGSV